MMDIHMPSQSMSRLEMLRQAPQGSQQHAAPPLKNQKCLQILAPHRPKPCFLRQTQHKAHRRRRLGIHSQVWRRL